MRRRDIFFPVSLNLGLDGLCHDAPHRCLYLLRSVVSLEPWFSKNRVTRPHYLNLFLLIFRLRLILLSLIECRVIVRLHTCTKDNLLLGYCACIVDQCVI
jgi:hypothetical protein